MTSDQADRLIVAVQLFSFTAAVGLIAIAISVVGLTFALNRHQRAVENLPTHRCTPCQYREPPPY